MWKVEKFNTVVQEYITKKKGEGDLLTKKDVYELLNMKYHVGEPDTIRKWGEKNNHGPRAENYRDIEEFFGLNPGELDDDFDGYIVRKDEKCEKSKDYIELDAFNKKVLLEVYWLLKKYLESDRVEEEEFFLETVKEVEKRKIALPEFIFDKIMRFIDMTLAPIIYDSENVFSKCYTSYIGRYDESGIFRINDEQSTRAFLYYYLHTLHTIEEELDTFAMQELHPLLVNQLR